MKGGFITLERRIFSDPFFAPEPMSEREAFIWMLCQASWEDTTHRVGTQVYACPRGSFFATLREMQGAFMWNSDKRVRTFLKSLENGRTIGRTTVGPKNARKTHVTICKYDDFQLDGRTKDAPGTHARTHRGRSKEEETNKTTPLSPQGGNVTEFPDRGRKAGVPQGVLDILKEMD